MDYTYLIDGMKKYGSTDEDICLHGIGILPHQVNENVVIAPWWEPTALEKLGAAEYLSESDFSSIKVWNVKSNDLIMTYIKTGIGAPVLMDALLSLGVTRCKRVVFIGSVGSLDEKIGIGDLVVPEYSICGDGASRYIAAESLKSTDVFGEKAYPDDYLFSTLYRNTKQVCNAHNVRFHIGKAFSTDTVFAQFSHLDEIIQMDCNVIEMETAAAFRAAQIANISLAALFSVSDNIVANKSLISGRTEEEKKYRLFTRREVFPEIILNTFSDMRTV